MKVFIKLQGLIIVLLFVASLQAQTFTVEVSDNIVKDAEGNQYDFKNDDVSLINAGKDDKLEVWGYNYYETSQIFKKDKNGNIVWSRVLVPSLGAWLYEIILATDGNIYVAGTLNGKLRLPNPEKKYETIELQANPESDEGNPYLLKLDKDGKLLLAVLLATDKDSYRIYGKPKLDYDKKTNLVKVKTEIRTSGSEDLPYMFKTFEVNATTGKIENTVEEEGGW